jgi:hypothetical protein
MTLQTIHLVIPGCALLGAGPESRSYAVLLDSGFAPKTRAPE